jgi:hypothetical protein
MSINLPSIFLCSPTSKQKDYCFKEWIENVSNLTYPNFKVFLSDNSIDNGLYAKQLNDYVRQNYNLKFYCHHQPFPTNTPLLQKIATSHYICSEAMKIEKCEYMLHLESDVFPEKDIIERLLWNNKDVCGAVYFTGEGVGRKVMLQRVIELDENEVSSINFAPNEEIGYLDGELKKVGHVGLGCVLIKDKVFEKVSFRFDSNYPNHSADSLFAYDCFNEKVDIWVDSSQVVKHKNKNWKE